jgi:hypothetical protein
MCMQNPVFRSLWAVWLRILKILLKGTIQGCDMRAGQAASVAGPSELYF